jgi:hypothetical protein
VRRGLIVLLALAAIAFAAFFVAVPIVIDRNLSAEAVAARASALAGRPVTVESVGVTFRPGLRIRAQGLRVEGGGSADAVEVEVAILPLLRRRIEPLELHLKGARLLVHRGADGWPRLRLLHPPGHEPGSGSGPSFPVLPALDASDGEIVLVDAAGRPTGAPRLRVLRLELAPVSPQGRIPFEVRLALDPEEGHRAAFGELHVECQLERLDGETRVRSGRLDGHDLVARGLRFERFEGRFDYAAGRVAVHELELDGYDGSAGLAGALNVSGPIRYQGTLRLEDLDLAAAIQDWRGGAALANDLGTLDASGEVDWNFRQRELGTGQGDLSIESGTLPAGSLFSALLGTLGRLTGQILSLGGAASPSPSQVERVTASWRLADDRLHTEDLEVVTDDYRYTAVGSLGLDQTLALSGTLHLTGRGAQRMLASASLPLPGFGSVIPAVPVNVAGRLDGPKVTASAMGLPKAAQGTLGGLVRGGGEAVGGAARGAKGALGKVLGR